MSTTQFEAGSAARMLAEALEDGHYGDCCTRGGEHCSDGARILARLQAANPTDVQGGAPLGWREEPAKIGIRPAAGAKAGNQFGTFKVVAASPAQVRFLKTCIETRDLSGLTERQAATVARATETLAAGEISKKLATSALDILANRPIRQDAPVAARKASEKQVALIARLRAEKGSEGPDAALLTPKEASDEIDRLLALPKPAKPATPAVVLESGMYKVEGGQIYKVYLNQAKTRMLAKALVEVEGEWEFQYAGMAERFVKADQRMSLEEAKAFGAIYGVCCNCAATLTDEKSIEAGIGPVCAKRI